MHTRKVPVIYKHLYLERCVEELTVQIQGKTGRHLIPQASGDDTTLRAVCR